MQPSLKSYADPEGGFSIACPSCRQGNILVPPGIVPPRRRFVVRCKCGHEFEAALEARQHSRENVQLNGKYTNLTTGRSGTMIIENLAMEGIGFRSTSVDQFNVGDLIVVAFELQSSNKPRIGAKLAVKQKHDQLVGCEILKIVEGAADYGLYLLG